MMSNRNVAIVGVGLIGRAWAAIVAVWGLGMAGLLTAMAMRRRIERRALELEAP